MKNKKIISFCLTAIVILFTGLKMNADSSGAVKKIQYPSYSYQFNYDTGGNYYYYYDLERNAAINFLKKITYPNANLHLITALTYSYPKGGNPEGDPISKNEVTVFPGQNKINVVETLSPGYPDSSFSFSYLIDKNGYYYNGELEGKFSWKGNSLLKVVNNDETITFKYDKALDYNLQQNCPDWFSLMITHYLGNQPFLDYWYAGSSFHPFDKLPSEITIDDGNKEESYVFDYFPGINEMKQIYWYIEVKTVVKGSMTQRDKIYVYL